MKKFPTPIQSLSAKLLPRNEEPSSNPSKALEFNINKRLNILQKKSNKPSSFSQIFNSEVKIRELPDFRKNSPESIQNFIQILGQQKSLNALKDTKKFELVGRQISQVCESSTNILKSQEKKVGEIKYERKKLENILYKPKVARKLWTRKSCAGNIYGKRQKVLKGPLIKVTSVEPIRDLGGCLQDSYSISINGWDED